MFVWFREQKYSGELGTPVYLSEKNALPKASANDSWGFMLRRDGSDGRLMFQVMKVQVYIGQRLQHLILQIYICYSLY